MREGKTETSFFHLLARRFRSMLPERLEFGPDGKPAHWSEPVRSPGVRRAIEASCKRFMEIFSRRPEDVAPDGEEVTRIPALTEEIIRSFRTGDCVTVKYFGMTPNQVCTHKGLVVGVTSVFRAGMEMHTVAVRKYRSKHIWHFRDGDLTRITQGWDFAAENEATRKFGKRFTEAMFGSKPVRRFEDILPATVTITCHLCDERFEATVEKTDLADNYTLLEDGTYDGSDADHWCDRCEEADQTNITRAWRYR